MHLLVDVLLVWVKWLASSAHKMVAIPHVQVLHDVTF